MPAKPKPKRSAAETARHYLSGGGVLREDSDDELGSDDLPWEWLYSSSSSTAPSTSTAPTTTTITGARIGAFTCKIGDTVLLKSPVSNEAWVAIIHSFLDGEDEDGEAEMKANMLWFSSEKEVRGKGKRGDAVEGELYLTADFDENSLSTINGKARVLGDGKWRERGERGDGKTFLCRRGVNTRTATYTEVFEWEEVWDGGRGLEGLVEMVEAQTVKTRTRRKSVKSVAELAEFIARNDDEDDALDPSTPRKRRRLNNSTTSTPSKSKPLTPRKFSTPSGRKIQAKRPLEYTPLGTRFLPATSAVNDSPHAAARSTLHVSALPLSLPCREAEFATIHSHLSSAITAGTGTCVYISGTPGTGKTATVREVIGSLQLSVEAEELDEFLFVEINGMALPDPHQAYTLLWEALSGERVAPSHALYLLETEFKSPSPRRIPIVVLMDELDQLVTRNQGVMYNFFNWPQLRHSRLVVLAVANTMDLPERTLSNKISSRLGLERIVFAGYTHTQLMTIIESRLGAVQAGKGVVVEPEAVQFASRKVAAVSGDARRALDICRRAVEIADLELVNHDNDDDGEEKENADTTLKKRGVVTITTIKRAINEATSTPLAAYLRSLPLASKVFLVALLAQLRRTGVAETTLAEVADTALKLAAGSANPQIVEFLLRGGMDTSTMAEEEEGIGFGTGKRGAKAKQRSGKAGNVARVRGLAEAARVLAEAGVIGVEVRAGERVGRVRLGVGEEEVRGALREDVEGRGLGFAG